MQSKWQEIENRIQTSRESIEQSNTKAAAANADKAVEEWNSAVIKAEIDADTSIDSQNFWVQTVVQATRRGNYSAKQIPFL